MCQSERESAIVKALVAEAVDALSPAAYTACESGDRRYQLAWIDWFCQMHFKPVS